jgi:hypothetical protein
MDNWKGLVEGSVGRASTGSRSGGLERTAAHPGAVRLWTILFLFLLPVVSRADSMGLIVPAYFSPKWQDASANYWDDLAAAAARVPLIAIMNPSDGPGNKSSKDFVRAVNEMHAAGGRVIGYVRTEYSQRSLARVKADIDDYYAWYGVDGIYLDRATTATTSLVLAYYADCYNYIRARDTDGLVVLGQGSRSTPDFLAASTQIMVFVNDYASRPFTTWQPDPWMGQQPADHFLAINYNAPKVADMRAVVEYAATINVRWVYVTDDGGSNPWDRLPSYWAEEIGLVAGSQPPPPTPPAPQPPAAPSALSAAPLSSTSVQLSWTDNADNETGFEIERATSGSSWTRIAALGADARAYTDGTAGPATYYYRVRAVNSAGPSAYSSAASATTPSALPAAPAALNAIPLNSASVQLSWTDNADNETGFEIERRADGTLWAWIATVGSDNSAYTDEGVDPGVAYYYQVRAVNSAGPSAYSNTASATTPSAPPQLPSAPSALSATPLSSTSAELSWTDNADDETGFEIYHQKNGGTWIWLGTIGPNVRIYKDSWLTASTTFNFRVRATNSAGKSSWAETSATTPAGPKVPAAPTGSIAQALSPSSIRVDWMDNAADEEGFELWRSLDGVAFVRIATLAADATIYTDTGLKTNTWYYYQVRAFNSIGPSAYSNTASAATPAVPPAAPTALSASPLSTTSVQLSWTDNAGDETGFEVERSVASGTWIRIAAPPADARAYTDGTVGPATTYSYRVRAVNSAGPSAYSNTASATTPAAPPASGVAMGIVVPAYFYPKWSTPSTNYWDDLIAAAARVPLIAIMNPSDGPGTAVDPGYVRAVAEMHAAGGRLVGYIRTVYTTRSLSSVKTDIDRYYSWYPGLDGIFLDEVTNDTDAAHLTYYQACFDYIRAKDADALVQQNPGAKTAPEYATRSTQICIFEDSASLFASYVPRTWTLAAPADLHFALGYNASAATMRANVDRAAKTNTRWVYFTDNLYTSNPWDSLPSYWTEEVGLVAATRVSAPAAKPVALEAVPESPLLAANYPNPFNAATQIAYQLPRAGDIELKVFDLLGQPVRLLVSGYQQAGAHQVLWNGTDDAGQPVASGVYLCRLADGRSTQARPMLLLK